MNKKITHRSRINWFGTFAALVFATTAQSETVTYYVPDHLGSPIAAMDQSGALLWRESFTPYGEKRLNPSQADDDTGYTGHQFDADTDLVYMQARYYDSVIGRFMAVDSASFSPQKPGTFGRFHYANNNPANRIDPDGRTDIYVGGKGDNVSRIVESYANAQSARGERTIAYFQHNQKSEIVEFAKANAKNGEPLNIIGHSYGASTAVGAAEELAGQGVAVDNLVGVDGVRKAFHSGNLGGAADGVTTIVGVNSTGGGTLGDAVEGIGKLLGAITTFGSGTPGAMTEASVDVYISSSSNHGDFAGAYETKGEDGRSAKDIVDSSYTDK